MIIRPFNTIGIITKPNDSRVTETLNSVVLRLKQLNYEIVLDQTVAPYTQQHTVATHELNQCDVVIVLGGDGTLLAAARTLSVMNVPIIGVNLGRLGFLVDVDNANKCEELEKILSGKYKQEDRILLQVSVFRKDKNIYQHNAMNDVVLHISDTVRMIEFETFINKKLVNSQRADGLVLSTPSGSTAYALSNGGPILHPSLHVMAMLPICPHTLSSRPIVIDANDEVTINLLPNNKSPAQVVCDGQSNIGILAGDVIKINKAKHGITLLHPEKYDYYHILREKLNWS